MPLKLFPFRYRDPLTGEWVRARYVAEPHEIAERYAEWEIPGPAEIREPGGGSFNPYRTIGTVADHLPVEGRRTTNRHRRGHQTPKSRRSKNRLSKTSR
jgi:hypothetical protein